MDTTNLITYLACICFIFLFGRIFIVPVKKVLKLIFNSLLGGLIIYIINLVGSSFGFHIGLNLFTSILVRLVRNTRSNTFSNYKTYNIKKGKMLDKTKKSDIIITLQEEAKLLTLSIKKKVVISKYIILKFIY